LTNRVRGVPLREHVLAERDTLAASATQAFLSTVFLLHQSWVMLDAIGRTLVRLFVTRRRMLEWITADRAARVEATPGAALRRMLATVITAVAIAVIVGLVAPSRLPLALPVVILWCLAPTLAYTTGRPLLRRHAALTVAQRSPFRRVARKTWRFFDELVTPTDHWLIPDNLQENRRELIAHRTSPTNIGLQLLSTLAAYDFGYITVAALLTRLEATLATLLKMQRYRGHFYNWYDTRTLEPLAPRYISTVDSGNLAGYLVTLRAALLDIGERAPVIDTSFLEGLEDLLGLAEEELGRGVTRDGSRTNSNDLTTELAELRAALADRPATPAAWQGLLA
jgi:cyclic beta-1,2-glucan synthetase